MRWKHLGTAIVVSMAFLAGRAEAQTDSQLPTPQLSTLMPCGGRAGSNVTVSFTGTDIEEPQALRFSNPGIQATPIVPPKPKADPKKPAPPQPPVTQFTVRIDPQTPPGFYDVRLVNRWGVSNPRTFVVGDLNEVLEKEPNDTEKQTQRVTLNTTVTGAIAAPTDVDYYVFAGKKGQRVLLSCLASSIDSRLEPEIRLYDSNNKQLALARDYKGTDALADCVLPADGDYTVRVCSFTYTEGSPEHFYRLIITTAPWIDAIHPCVVEPGKPTQVTVYGRNLPGGTLDPAVKVRGNTLERLSVTVTPPADPQARYRLTYSGNADPRMAALDAFEYRVRNAAGVSNPFLLALARAPVVTATGKQTTPQTAQPLQIPSEVAGRVLARNEGDWFNFTAHKGETIAIDVTSDRLGSQADMYFLLRNAANHQDIAEVDTHTEVLTNNLKFYQATEDPGTYLFAVPADGRYELLVGSRYAASVFGIRHYYRLRLTRPEPDFHLVVLPAADSRQDAGQLLQNGEQLFTVLAWRHDGWDGPIHLSVDGLPPGVTCPPQTLAAGLRQTSLVLSAAPNAPAWTGDIHVKGTATINGKDITHEARSASVTWPVQPGSGIPAVARLDRSLALAVRDKAPFRLDAKLDVGSVVQGANTNLTVKLTRLWPDFKTPMTVQLHPLEGIPNVAVNNGGPITLNPGKDDINVPVAVNAQAAPGTYNLVLRGTGQVPFNKDPKAKQKPPINVIQPATPVGLTVLPKQVATVTVTNPNPTVKAGSQSEVVVRVARRYGYTGPFQVKLVLPKGTTGLAAADSTIAAGKDEGRLVLKVPANTPPGARPNLVVQLTAMLPGNVAVVQEAKLNVIVMK